MKIVMSADWFYPAQTGGPSNAIYWQAKALTRAGHDVTVVATAQDLPPMIPLDQWLTLDCGRVMYTRNPYFYLPIKHIWYGWQAIREADIVHVNSLFYPASAVWVLMSRLVNKPIVWSPHGELSPAALHSRPILKKGLLMVFRWLGSPVWFHATCTAEVAHIQQHFGRDARVGQLQNRMELPPVVAPVSTDQPYLLFMGRLHPIKAIDQLLEALSASTLFRQSKYHLLIAGPDSDKTYARKLRQQVQTLTLSAKVTFVGAVRGHRKEQLYANARLLVLPSHSENFGNVVIESLAQGTPVIASIHTPWQVLETERAGQWVPNDPESLQRSIELFLTMPADEYEPYRTRALALARRDYDSSAGTALWEDFYNRVLTPTKEPSTVYGLYPAKNTR